ncbi:peptidase inhibitor 16 [Haplochromis burtoni]|uniref:peptidase inhibitor 16 n=1 Tax=Haplochromis burtoni TaxID=8153 RepID=UPI0003BD299A|nr:peptidase inhibitor 16 [Haplochromis burtoni]
MHLRGLSALQGVSTQRRTMTPWTTQDGASCSSRERTGSSGRCSPLRRAPLWVWLLLGALVVPGAWSFLNEEQEEMLVELHNHFRGQVSPSASAMMPLKWDPNLKVVAEGYAAKCIWNHNPELEDTGENLYAGTGPLDLRMALEKWFLERLDYDFQNNSCDEDKMCGHYTQMVWADTHRVGCAFHLCDTMEGLDWDRVSFLVCNYYPAGNYEGVRPYVEGDWCSRCPENLQKCENSLCVPDTVEEEDEDDDDVTADPMLTTGESSPDATTDPLQPTDEYAVPTTPDFPVESTTADGIPSVPTVHFASSTEDTPPPHTTAEATKPPSAPPTTLATLINKIGPDTREEEKEQEKEEEEKLNETPHKEEKGVKGVVGSIINKDSSAAQNSAGSMSSPSVLLACLTPILIVRL